MCSIVSVAVFLLLNSASLFAQAHSIVGGVDKGEFAGFISESEESLTLEERHPISRKRYDQGGKNGGFDPPLKLTMEEAVWLREHPRIRVAVMDAWPPMDFLDTSGRPVGIGVDFIHVINTQLGGILEITPGTFKNNMDKVRDRRMDALLDVTPKPERRKFLNFTRPYLTIPHVIVGRKDGQYFSSELELTGKTIALEKGFFNVKYFKETYPDITIQEYPDTSRALGAVARGRADAYAGNRAVAAWIMEREIMSNLRIQGRLEQTRSVLTIGVRKDWPILASILDKALAAVPMDEVVSIRSKWTGLAHTDSSAPVELTPEEKAWIQAKNAPVIVGVEMDWPPYDFMEDGEVMGYSNELVKLVAQKTGLSLQFISGYTWAQLVEKFESREIDLLPAVYKTPEREKNMAFTKSYAANPSVLVVHEDRSDTKGFEDLSQKKLAVPKGFSITDHLLKIRPDIIQVEVANVLEGLKAVSLKKADAFVGSLGVISYFLKENLIPGLRIVDEVVLDKDDAVKLHVAMKKDQVILGNIVQKGLDAVTEAEWNHLRLRWLVSEMINPPKARLKLTDREKEWLRQAKPVRISVDPSWLPIERINPETGRHEGIAADFIQLISEITGLQFNLVSTPDWSASVDLAKSGDIDMLPTCSKTVERETFLDFSVPYLELSNAVVMKNDVPFLNDIGELAGKQVGISEGTSIHHHLAIYHPELKLVPVKGSLNGLEMVSRGRIDAFIDTLEVLGYLINTHGLFHLKVSLRLQQKRNLCMALRKGMAPELMSILNKGIEVVTPEETNGFYRRWISLTVDEKVDYTIFWEIGVPVAGVIFLIMTIISVWNRKLAREIDERKKVETILSDALNLITSSIRYAGRIQRSVLPQDDEMKSLLKNYFVLWKPRDMVGGDIYWGTRWGGGTLIMLADCTGHGVPGAFMTLISTGALDRALMEVEEGNVAALIRRMHQLVQNTLSQRPEFGAENSSDEGLELGFCYLSPDKESLTFSGAGFPLFIAESGEVKMVKGHRKGIGYRSIANDAGWTNHVLSIEKGQRFYMASDGIFDQVGGPKKIGFGKKRFIKMLSAIQGTPITEQGEKIYQELAAYQGNEKRRDDISAIGFTL